MSLRDRIRGVLGFPVTPFRKDLSLDLDALARNVDEMASHPFCALVAAGGTGELYSLTPEEIEQVVRVTVDTVNGRMPVVAGTGYSAPIGADIARRVERAGADSILVLPPYYSNAPFEGMIHYYAAIGAATPLPLMIYSRDWAIFTPGMVARVARIGRSRYGGRLQASRCADGEVRPPSVRLPRARQRIRSSGNEGCDGDSREARRPRPSAADRLLRAGYCRSPRGARSVLRRP